MKRIEAIVRPSKLDDVMKALGGKPSVSGVTVAEVQGFGRQLGHSEVYAAVENEFTLVPKRMLVLYVADNDVEDVIQSIVEAAQTGKIGDGKIVVHDVHNLIRVRTGEQGESAL